jgi:hypothetical protein
MHRYHREESFKPKNVPLAPQEVIEQKLVLIIVVEKVNEMQFFFTYPKKMNNS